MHQRHPIGVDKSRALTAGSDRQMSSANQVSFHKIYRQKRRYSLVDKGKEGHSGSQWRSEYANSSRDSNVAPEPRHTAGSNGFKTTRSVDCEETIMSGSPSSSILSERDFAKSERDFAKSERDFARSYRDFPKRSFDRFPCNSSSGLEFDAPVVKKQKVESYKPSAPQHYVSPDFDRGEHKSPLEETKWMYKNQHGKMSGPYGVKQLMEGLQARFLQKDLPIYQLHEGKLCKPVMLKQLMDDSQWSVRDSGRRHLNPGLPSQQLAQGPVEESAGQVADDIDLPPGFGGRSSQFAGKSSCDYSPSSTVSVAGPRCATRGVTSLGSDFGDHDSCLPPGFECGAATESHTSELCESPKRLSMAAWREKVQAVQSSYEQREPMVQDRVHSSWQGNSPRPVVSFPKQGAKAGTENFSNGHATWPYAPAASKLSSFESQAFSQPAVCIGLPVRNLATQSWPIATTLPSGASNAEPYGYPNASAPPNHTLATKEPIGFSQMHGPDPLTLILTELLAAVKRTYVNSVLSALIGEQLECWLDANKSWTGSSLSPEKNSFGRGACHQLSRAEVNKGSAETSASHIEATGSTEASTLCMKSTTSTLHLKSSLRIVPGSAEASALHIEASSSPEASTLRGEASTANTTSSHPDVVSQVRDDAQCAEGSLVTYHEASVGSEPNQTSSPVLKEEKHHQSAEENSIDDGSAQSSGNVFNAGFLEAQLLPLATRSTKGNLKSLKQLMLITSKLRSRQSKSSLLKKSASKVTCAKSPEVLEIRQRSGLPQGYDGCARTSIFGSTWLSRGQVDGHYMESWQNEGQCSKTGELGVSTRMQTRAQSAQSRGAPVVSLAGCSEGADAVKLTLSKVRKRKLKVARSKIHKWGVFSVEAVEAGDFVTEYLGELVRSRIAEIREEQYVKSGAESGYVLRIDKDCAVDATKRGGLARFINHSCDPNCFIKIVSSDESKRILIFAKRQIQAGEEVTFDYTSVLRTLNIVCRCGSSECGGSSV